MSTLPYKSPPPLFNSPCANCTGFQDRERRKPPQVPCPIYRVAGILSGNGGEGGSGGLEGVVFGAGSDNLPPLWLLSIPTRVY